eukprot:9948670-Alexandrium_andersonii.AAC.1
MSADAEKRVPTTHHGKRKSANANKSTCRGRTQKRCAVPWPTKRLPRIPLRLANAGDAESARRRRNNVPRRTTRLPSKAEQ